MTEETRTSAHDPREGVEVVEEMTPESGQASAPAQIVTMQTEEPGAGQADQASPSRPPLYRHPSNRAFGGVCGGLADYLNLDAGLIRVLWIVLTIGSAGAGFLAYMALWLLLPVGTAHTGMQEPAAMALNQRNMRRAGLLLIGLGSLWLLANVGILPWLWSAFWRTVGIVFWPAVLIAAGMLLLKNQKEWRSDLSALGQRLGNRAQFDGLAQRAKSVNLNGLRPDGEKVRSGLSNLRQRIPLKRSREDRVVLGVCGGMARSLKVDANLVRLFWVLFSVGSIGTGAVIYALMALILPETRPVPMPEPQVIQHIER